MSKEASRKGFELTLMERIIDMWGSDNVVRMLKVQYRMHQDIMEWSSNALYSGLIVAHQSVAKHLLKDLEGVQEDENTGTFFIIC